MKITSGFEGVIVGATFVDWTPPGGPDGTFGTSIGTTLTYDAGTPLGTGAAGRILDLVALPPLPGFMVFPVSAPGLVFDLEALGPGSANTDCTQLGPCSVFVGSPFTLERNGANTTISLNARGTVTDNTAAISYWNGAFTTQIVGRTPEQIQADFLNVLGHTEESTYSAEFIVSPIPEPATAALIGAGLLVIGWTRRRRRV
ncbi:MAG: PEP-CTERM sorting domain-containing protein [Bryobacteraceae bacterium]